MTVMVKLVLDTDRELTPPSDSDCEADVVSDAEFEF